MGAYQLTDILLHEQLDAYRKRHHAMVELNIMRNHNYCVAVDFDGTLCESKFPEIGNPNTEIINRIKLLQEWGIKVILWTCREGETLTAAVDWCEEQGITFDAINENLPSLKAKWGNDPRKIGAAEYWDDRAVCIHGGVNPCEAQT